MTEELYNKIDKFCNETDWSKYPTYEHAKDTDLHIDKPVYAIHLTGVKERE